MSSFTHYTYVLECSDGTLYTGYATNVQQRLATHNAGKGAKYTKTRTPVTLLAQARWHTKHQAMSAEAHFKQLSRDKKDVLLAKAVHTPFEQVLLDAIPALHDYDVFEFIAAQLEANEDTGYKDFMAKLMPSVDPKTIVGVRTPALRKIAKQLAKHEGYQHFLRAAPHALFEENQLHSFSLASIKDYDRALAHIEFFLPCVDNWTTCDQLPNKMLMQRPQETLGHIERWIECEHVYTARYGIETLMQYYLDELFEPRFIDLVVKKHVPGYEKPETASDAYYMDMMRAWFLAEAVAKQPDSAIPYLEKKKGQPALDEWTRKKAIQKAVESFRVPEATKTRLKAARAL